MAVLAVLIVVLLYLVTLWYPSLLIIDQPSTSIGPTPYDIVLYDLGENNTTVIVKDKTIAFESMAPVMSKSYIVWNDNWPESKITIMNISSSNKITHFPEIAQPNLAIYNDNVVFYTIDRLNIYNISANHTARVFNNTNIYLLDVALTGNLIIYTDYNKTLRQASLRAFNLTTNETTVLGEVGRYFSTYNNFIFTTIYHENNKDKIKLILYNIENNSVEVIAEGNSPLSHIAVNDDYLIWKLENNTLNIRNLSSGVEKSVSFPSGSISSDFSVYNDTLVYSENGLDDNSEIYLYNIKSGEFNRLTNTPNHDERFPQIDGQYIMWIAFHQNDNRALLNFQQFILIAIIIIVSIIIWRRAKKKVTV